MAESAVKKTQRKSRLATKKEILYLLSRLRTLDPVVMRSCVLRYVEECEADHLDFYATRRATWEEWKSAEALDKLLSFLWSGFCDLLERHTVGAERFANFLVAWYNFVGSVAVQSMSSDASNAVWTQLTVVTRSCMEEDRSPLIHCVAKSVYVFAQKQIALLQSMWATNQCQLITTEANPGTDDDTSLYRLFGFSMFVSIQFRKRVWFGRLRKRYTYEHRCAMRREYTLLTLLVESDKSVLPACIKFQDRGKMTFPHHSFLPFARACSKSIKTYLNDNAYKRHGRHVVQITKKAVLGNDELLQQFRMFVNFQTEQTVESDTAKLLYRELVSRVIHTMANSFFQCQEVLNRIVENKGVDAQVTLRDKLKVYAGESKSKLVF